MFGRLKDTHCIIVNIYIQNVFLKICFRYVLNDEGNIVTASTADHDYGQVNLLTC